MCFQDPHMERAKLEGEATQDAGGNRRKALRSRPTRMQGVHRLTEDAHV